MFPNLFKLGYQIVAIIAAIFLKKRLNDVEDTNSKKNNNKA
jgi:hypothetical protein